MGLLSIVITLLLALSLRKWP